MDTKGLLDRAKELFSYFETENVRDLILNLDRQGFMILVGVAALLVLLFLIKRMVRTATLIVALCAITVLLHFTIPEQGQAIQLPQLVGLFIGGTFIVATSLYIIFIRAD